MDELGHIMNENDLHSTLALLNQEEKTIENEIDSLLCNETELKQLVDSLMKHMSNISLIENDAERLSNLMGFTSKLADSVSHKIRSFDLVKNRVGECLKQVEDIIDLRSCTDGIQKSLMNEDYEEAARHIYRFLSMDESMLRKSASEDFNGNATDLLDTCSLEQSFGKLHEAEQKLKLIVMNRFDEAVKDKDIASVERFFKIFPLINQRMEGLTKLSQYLCGQINEKMSQHKSTNVTSRSAAYLEKLSHLFETIAQTIDIHYPLIETYYGPGNLYHLVVALQTECDRQSTLIINEFKLDKNFVTLTVNITKYLKMNNPTQQQSTQQIDSKEIDKHLTDMMYLMNRSQTYLNFISTRLLTDIDDATQNQHMDGSKEKGQRPKSSLIQLDPLKVDQLIRECQLTQMIHDLNSTYVLFERYFLKESIFKAIQLDMVDLETNKAAESVLTSSMLDDIFFIIKKCMKRSISCGSINVILAMINNCVAVLDTDFFDVMQERVKIGYPNNLSTLDLSNAYTALQAGRYLQSSTEMERMRISFISSLNNLDTACDYINLLSSTIREDVSKSSGIIQKNQVDLFDSCLSDFSSICAKFRKLISGLGMQHLFGSVFKSTVKAMVDSFTSANNQLSDEDVISYESTDGVRPFVQGFLVNFNSQIQSFKKQLTMNNFDLLLSTVSSEISNRLYKALFKCTFNKFGGFQFDREVRSIINYITSISSISVRENFSKLKFICVVFTLENVDEINEYINSEGNNTALRINPNELHQLLRLYTELAPADIRKIKL
ncbi:Golgi transport complex subunit 4 [Blomia tropicalis]|nr:Golgi transport complex subunit 4 [Blomia tropicalis]